MAFITATVLIDAPASALNNQGAIEGARTDNTVGVKFISTKQGIYPYVSSQAIRYWIREVAENNKNETGWNSAPIFRDKKIAYTDANPIEYWDDDLFGYMRAESKKSDSQKAEFSGTETKEAITRISPVRIATFVSIAPQRPTDDFGTMSRHEGDPVPFEHQFYKTILKGALSIDLKRVGVFSFVNKTGYKNLDEVRIKKAEEKKLKLNQENKTYSLPTEERIMRVRAVLSAIANLEGGAKQGLHYTDVSPAVFITTVTKGGNNPLQYIINPDINRLPEVNVEAVEELVRVWGNEIIGKIYIGWKAGFYDEQKNILVNKFKEIYGEDKFKDQIVTGHPKEVIKQLNSDLEKLPIW